MAQAPSSQSTKRMVQEKKENGTAKISRNSAQSSTRNEVTTPATSPTQRGAALPNAALPAPPQRRDDEVNQSAFSNAAPTGNPAPFSRMAPPAVNSTAAKSLTPAPRIVRSIEKKQPAKDVAFATSAPLKASTRFARLEALPDINTADGLFRTRSTSADVPTTAKRESNVGQGFVSDENGLNSTDAADSTAVLWRNRLKRPCAREMKAVLRLQPTAHLPLLRQLQELQTTWRIPPI
jgi:hypothetical protein